MSRNSLGLAVACWWFVVALGSLGVGVRDSTLTPGAAIMALLLVVAPAALAVPAGRHLARPLWSLETIASWAVLGILVALVDPLALGTGLAFLLLVPVVFGALAAPSLLIAAWFAPERAMSLRRQGYCWATLPTGLLLLRGLDAFEPLIVLIFCALVVLVVASRWSIGRHSISASTTTAQMPSSDSGTPATAAPTARRVASFPAVMTIGTRGRLD